MYSKKRQVLIYLGPRHLHGERRKTGQFSFEIGSIFWRIISYCSCEFLPSSLSVCIFLTSSAGLEAAASKALFAIGCRIFQTGLAKMKDWNPAAGDGLFDFAQRLGCQTANPKPETILVLVKGVSSVRNCTRSCSQHLTCLFCSPQLACLTISILGSWKAWSTDWSNSPKHGLQAM